VRADTTSSPLMVVEITTEKSCLAENAIHSDVGHYKRLAYVIVR
jgi:hypothetical protein